MPRKKSKGRPPAKIRKQINRAISPLRVPVEHAVAGVKRRRIVADIHRNFKAGLEDAVMLTARGLHNFRVSRRRAA